MFQIELANKVVRIDNHFLYVFRQCDKYLIEDETPYEIFVFIPDEEIERECRDNPGFSKEYCESICVYRKIAVEMLSYGVLLVHGAVISCQGRGYLFAAPSGTGKSTHIRYWKDCFGEQVTIINGDKPLLEFRQDGVFAYGTPWCGKEGWETKGCVKLDGICFLERGTENRIHRIEGRISMGRLFRQLYIPEKQEQMEQELDLVQQLLEKVSFYHMRCTNNQEAAQIARKAMEENRI